jgi:hypothetical protein
MLLQFWPRTPYPFESPSVQIGNAPKRQTETSQARWWDLKAGPVSRARLAHYARAAGIASHVLQGSIGKAHDVINVAAGLKPIDLVKAKPADPELEFVDYDEFRAMLRDSGMARHSQDKIRAPIRYGLMNQVRSGSVATWARCPEIITEGRVEWVSSGTERVPHPEKIALVSLTSLIEDVYNPRNPAPSQFLEQFA